METRRERRDPRRSVRPEAKAGLNAAGYRKTFTPALVRL
jgi:hypothetical protein